ncbi:MAG: hypothetical protein NZ849_11570 [Meiothermus sp.]|uniref:hypothetical protein n=1 Tax=Thermaceae TaxID=188786 RepID=UPI0025FA18F4|nr:MULTISPECIES: hypothetical protein [Thermaceae]MCS7059098.1 hypothetical protein [Meiothermus sp.]MCS7195530.1 hypothetical protein [Meiothermus sp.]MCX7850299.1 hypothetical protein [Thermus sp.]MDW8090458.1 hypothetical protein [Meiothermus sp.]MDW8481041.1 hypothetical protein [Meiothermus sp.]
MESLGHYLLRGRLRLLEDGVEVYEGQDARTGLEVVVFRPLEGTPPQLALPCALPWIDCLEGAWVAEVPVGAVRATWLAGQVEPGRLAQWVRQLSEALEKAREAGVPVGYVVPELIWTRGRRVWLGGLGVGRPEQRWDYEGFLQTVRALAGELYPALPWREALEAYATGQLEAATFYAQLEAPPAEPSPLSVVPLEGAPPSEPPPEARAKGHLRVQVNEPPPPPPAQATPPRRIRIEERTEPPFEVVVPPERRRLRWLWLLPLVLLLGGMGLWWRGRAPTPAGPALYPVEFRLEPPGPKASVAVLEAPEGSQMPVGVELAEVPGVVVFDRPGVYRIRIRVPGRVPVESLIEVPSPGGISIQLR